jgi:hypothetical protein
MENTKENTVEQFKVNQTLSSLQKIKNAGLQIRELKANKWIRATRYSLPVRFVRLYDKDFNLEAIGIY